MASVFITGGTGFLGRALIPALLHWGHTVRALVRPSSEAKLPAGCDVVTGNALDRTTFADKVAPADTFVQLVGIHHPLCAEPGLTPASGQVCEQCTLQSANHRH